MNTKLQSVFVWGVLFFGGPACAQDIENDVPISAEATTAVVPGKEADIAPATNVPAGTVVIAPPKPDRIYTDGALANPKPKAEDLGMAPPGNKTVIDAK